MRAASALQQAQQQLQSPLDPRRATHSSRVINPALKQPSLVEVINLTQGSPTDTTSAYSPQLTNVTQQHIHPVLPGGTGGARPPMQHPNPGIVTLAAARGAANLSLFGCPFTDV